MPRKDKVVHNGKAYISIGATARSLGANAAKVRKLMSSGDLEWTQVRINGPIVIPAESLVEYKKRLSDPK